MWSSCALSHLWLLPTFPFTFAPISPPSTQNLSLILELINPAQGREEAARTLSLPSGPPDITLSPCLSSAISFHPKFPFFCLSVVPLCFSDILSMRGQDLHVSLFPFLNGCQSIITNKRRAQHNSAQRTKKGNWYCYCFSLVKGFTAVYVLFRSISPCLLKKRQISPLALCQRVNSAPLRLELWAEGIYSPSV